MGSQLITIRPQLEDELKTTLFSIPWGHQRVLLDKFKGNPEKAFFFVHKAQEQNWSRSVLLNFIDTDLYVRQGKAISKISSVLPSPQSDLAQEITNDPYNFNFLTLDKKYEEKDLKDALINNVSNVSCANHLLKREGDNPTIGLLICKSKDDGSGAKPCVYDVFWERFGPFLLPIGTFCSVRERLRPVLLPISQ